MMGDTPLQRADAKNFGGKTNGDGGGGEIFLRVGSE